MIHNEKSPGCKYPINKTIPVYDVHNTHVQGILYTSFLRTFFPTDLNY